MSKMLFTSESVTDGHPDKICDQISDAILDEHIAQDPFARVACECAIASNKLFIMGEITSKGRADEEKIARSVIRDIGYKDQASGYDPENIIIVALNTQSPDIAMGVDKGLEYRNGRDSDGCTAGAGDQGMMFGFACDETPELMPLPISLAHALTRRLSFCRKSGKIPFLRPDGKAQVTVKYEDGIPSAITTVVISAQHDEDITEKELEQSIIECVVNSELKGRICRDTRILVNPTGRFVTGGPAGDSGLTGRKIIVDTYGGFARHGGGSFSGKDPSKVDRSGAYAARYIAKNIVAAGLAKRCELQIAYAIGVAKPVSVMADTNGTGVIDDDRLAELIVSTFDLRPEAIIENLKLRRPIYRPTAAFGHFGRPDLNLPWENTDRVNELKRWH
ncbi:MAG: S-adenosylmethionine synthase [Firmicutes bacterium ADurb.Bin182]|nr:MAG: S-adenosylmethionine synthase [Firmicutes bacterium ADurb.Bin182]